jgi:hypothetical protein
MEKVMKNIIKKCNKYIKNANIKKRKKGMKKSHTKKRSFTMKPVEPINKLKEAIIEIFPNTDMEGIPNINIDEISNETLPLALVEYLEKRIVQMYEINNYWGDDISLTSSMQALEYLKNIVNENQRVEELLTLLNDGYVYDMNSKNSYQFGCLIPYINKKVEINYMVFPEDPMKNVNMHILQIVLRALNYLSNYFGLGPFALDLRESIAIQVLEKYCETDYLQPKNDHCENPVKAMNEIIQHCKLLTSETERLNIVISLLMFSHVAINGKCYIFSQLPNLLRISEMLSEKVYGREEPFDFIGRLVY